MHSDFAVNKSHIDLINAGAGRILFFARLCYSDVFEELNWTDVCLLWHKAGDSLDPVIVTNGTIRW